jgi:hypothetical protein
LANKNHECAPEWSIAKLAFSRPEVGSDYLSCQGLLAKAARVSRALALSLTRSLRAGSKDSSFAGSAGGHDNLLRQPAGIGDIIVFSSLFLA